MKKRNLVMASATAAIGLLASATPSAAKAATVDVTWRYEPGGRGAPGGCLDPVITSSKDISNLVFVVDGETHKIEFKDGTTEYVLPGEVTEVWVKSGNNGHRGLGEHVVPIVDQNCVADGGGDPSGGND